MFEISVEASDGRIWSKSFGLKTSNVLILLGLALS